MTTTVLESPRARRRLAWALAVVAGAAAVALLTVLLPSRSAGVETATPVLTAPAQVVTEPPHVRAPRAEIDRLLDAFVPAVIARRDLAAGWELVTPDARGSRAEWMRGNTPFQSFDARGTEFHGWRVNYSYPGGVGFDLFLAPRTSSDISMAFRGEAKKIGGRWRIAVFYPQATFQPAGKTQTVVADTDFQPKSVVSSYAAHGRLSAAWLILPGALVAALVLGALAVATVRWARTRSSVRQIERELAHRR